MPPAGPSRRAFDRLTARFAAGLRAGSVVAGSVAAFAGMAPPAAPAPVAAAVALLLAWAAGYLAVAVRRGLLVPLVAADVVIASGLCVAHPRLVSAAVLADGTSWVFVVASTTVIVSQLSPRPAAGLAALGAVPVAHAAGLALSGRDGLSFGMTGILLVQGGLVAGLMVILRRSSGSADVVLADYDRTQQAAEVRAARRAEEREHNRLLHDSVSATLTVVSTGGVSRDSPTLRAQAVEDLKVLERIHSPSPDGEGGGRLGDWLGPVLAAAVPALDVRHDVADVEVPPAVGAALAAATAEALTNVSRHAGAGQAQLRARSRAGAVLVEIVDSGRGFDPALVPAHRRGLRESLAGRMRSVGGAASVRSRPGAGTRVTLRWPSG